MIDIRTYGAKADGSTDSVAAINAALLAGDIIIENGVFLISESIKIPSNRTIYGKNAKIKIADNAFDNIFRNSDWINGNSNIHIIGQGNFSIDGNVENNNDDYATYGGKQTANSYKYVTISFFKVTNFSIKNLTVIDYPHHCIHLNKCAIGEIDNIYFNHKIVTLNQDGIDIAWGCNNITINKLHGYTADDFIAFFTGIKGDLFASYDPGFNVGDIHDITITDVLIKNSHAGAFPAIIGGNGNKIHDISMSNIVAKISGSLMFSNYELAYTGTPPTVNDIYNIIIDDVEINTIVTRTAALIFGQNMKDSAFTNIVNNSGKPMSEIIAGTTLQNVTINGLPV